MGAVDQSEEARAWLRTEIELQCFGEEFGFDVAPQVLPSGDGMVYVVVLTTRSPLLGQSPLMHVAGVPASRLTPELVKHVVTSGLRALRQLSVQTMAAGNGSALNA